MFPSLFRKLLDLRDFRFALDNEGGRRLLPQYRLQIRVCSAHLGLVFSWTYNLHCFVWLLSGLHFVKKKMRPCLRYLRFGSSERTMLRATTPPSDHPPKNHSPNNPRPVTPSSYHPPSNHPPSDLPPRDNPPRDPRPLNSPALACRECRGAVGMFAAVHCLTACSFTLLPRSVMTASMTDGFASWSQNVSVTDTEPV